MSRRPPAARLVGLFVVFSLGFVGVAARLVLLQANDTQYAELAEAQRVRRVALTAERGTIYDRSMHELALSLPAQAVYADPRAIADPERVASQLSDVLALPVPRLESMLASDDPFVYLARRLDLRVARQVERMAIPGIGLLDESKRYYPGEDLAAQVLGFVGVDGNGLAGLELQYQRVLAGRAGSLVVEQDPSGMTIPQGIRQDHDPERGRDVVLTIDTDLQFHAERALAQAVRMNGAKGGTVIVMDPATGEVLAMATAPTFDANAFGEAEPDLTRNRGVTDVYEPGSVNKVITAAAALEEGVVGLRERLWVPDRYQVGDKLFHEAHRHPTMAMTLTDVIAQSSNVGTIMTAERLGAERLDRYLRAFGFGEETGIGFPGEADGILMPRDEWWSTSMGTIPIGQGIAVTPLQMLSVYATLANEGVRIQPRLIRGTIDEEGGLDPVRTAEPVRVISQKTARLVTGMLSLAVSGGTGQEAQIPGFWVAGKTGTARKPLEGELGYSEEYVASFMGFAPASDPAIVVAAILDEPETVYGGIAAAPLFREVASFALARLRVPTAPRPRTPPSVVEG
jgi:cell division protein FtsI (penicillin-binding protein 3)